MTKEEVKDKLASFALKMVEINLDNNLSYLQKKKKHDQAYEDIINELEIPFNFECDICEDTGEVTTMEKVYNGEPHEAPIGSKTCICRIQEEDDRQED